MYIKKSFDSPLFKLSLLAKSHFLQNKCIEESKLLFFILIFNWLWRVWADFVNGFNAVIGLSRGRSFWYMLQVWKTSCCEKDQTCYRGDSVSQKHVLTLELNRWSGIIYLTLTQFHPHKCFAKSIHKQRHTDRQNLQHEGRLQINQWLP